MENTTEERPNRLVIQSKARGNKWEKQFFLEVQDAILSGYRIADNDSRQDLSLRNFRGRIGRVVFYLEDDQDEHKVEFQLTSDSEDNPDQLSDESTEDNSDESTEDNSDESTEDNSDESIEDFIEEKIEEIQQSIEQEEKVTIEVTEDLEIIETSALEQIKDLTKKNELVVFADKFALEIPEDMTNPNAIKKHLKGLLST